VVLWYESILIIYLQVQWDEPTSFPRPDRVSPWEIEPILASVPTKISSQTVVIKNKRPRQASEVSDLGEELPLLILSSSK